VAFGNQREEYLDTVAVADNIDTVDASDETMLTSGENRITFPEQDYWCRNPACRITVRSSGIPNGWYIVKKSFGNSNRLKTIAMACSLSCLVMDSVTFVVSRLRSIEARGGSSY
jgi:hypothetical protein